MMASRRPTQEQINEVMQETGMAEMQAYNHLVQRFILEDMERRGGVTQRTMGKSCYDPR